MKKIAKIPFVIFGSIVLLYATTAFIISDPKADFVIEEPKFTKQIYLSEIRTENSERGCFKTAMEFKKMPHDYSKREFYGYEIGIANNPKVDRILIGITNNLISRIEIWNQNELVKSKEKGFMGKMTWGDFQTISVEMYDQTNTKYAGKSKIYMRFYEGTGFLGDIGGIDHDLSEYADLSADKSIGLFSKFLESESVKDPEFSNLKIWKNYKSFD